MMIVVANKVGAGMEDDCIRPDTDAKSWEMVSETDTTMTIRIKD
jgi:hypothetical protein